MDLGTSRIFSLGVACLLGVSCVVVATPWDWGSGFSFSKSSAVFIADVIQMLLSGNLLIFLLWNRKVGGRRGKMVAFFVLGQMLLGLCQALLWSFRSAHDDIRLGCSQCESPRHDVSKVLYGLSAPVATISNVLTDAILLDRVSLLGRTLGRTCQVRAARRLFQVCCFFAFFCCWMIIRVFSEYNSKLDAIVPYISGAASIFLQLFRSILFLLALQLFSVPVRAFRAAKSSALGNELLQSRPDLQSTALLEFGVLALNTTIAVMLASAVWYALFVGGADDFQVAAWLLLAVDSMSNIGLIVVMTGMLKHDRNREKAANQVDRLRLERQSSTREAYEKDADGRWQEVVEELASRGFTLASLLAFYKTIPEAMPHFDPNMHTTEDVVRQVIIPKSADQKCAYAVKMMDGAPTRPERMVTHNWSNLFRDLIAAIVADALNEPSFSLIASLLDKDIAALERMLGAKALATTYWVCAFSVNQHASICGFIPPQSRGDPKTGIQHAACPCGYAKYLNGSPPLRSDSKSIPCQMNKFDDMMAFLSASDPKFAQVVAVDRGFVLFDRAWCVAEVAEANKMGMRQFVKLSSKQALGEQNDKLKDLDVRNMQAARMEDVKEILAKIPDVTSFNSDLHEMLFGQQGLFDRLGNFDVVEQAAQIGKAALFADASLHLNGGGIVGKQKEEEQKLKLDTEAGIVASSANPVEVTV